MSLVDDVFGILPTLRAQAESLMLDSCTITRANGTTVDDNTGDIVPNYDPVYDGKCKVQQTISQSSNPEAGNRQFTVLDSSVHLPVGVGPVAVGDVVTVTAATLDPALLGNVYRVTETYEKSFATAQRVRVEEVL